MTSISVVLCCNDRNGDLEGCVSAVKVGNCLDLEAISLDRPPRIGFVQFSGLTRIVRISGRAFPITGYSHCQPALTADTVWMEPAIVAELLNFLKSKGTFSADGGKVWAAEIWDREGGAFTACELEGKA